MRTAIPIILSAAVALFMPLVAQAQVRMRVDQLPPIAVVQETRSQLQAVGCEAHIITQPDQPALLESTQPYPVIPEDVITHEVWFCSREVVDGLHVIGRVSGALEDLRAFWKAQNWDVFFENYGDSLSSLEKWWAATKGGANTLAEASGQLAEETALDWIIKGLRALIGAIAVGLVWVLQQLVKLMVPLLTTSDFFTNKLVIGGWTFVLGIANLGFVLALLFIALVTILRVGGFDTRRLLVRLLIAALLINFSLLIAIVILDFSRLAMAAIARGIAGRGISELGISILEASGVVGEVGLAGNTPLVIDKGQIQTWSDTAELGNLFYGLILIVTLLFGFVLIASALIGRYLMLILLLVVSPLAYLFLAMPTMGNLAKQWWSTYLKYVFYGPIVIFILALIPLVNSVDLGIPFLAFALTVALLYLATFAGRSLAILTAGAAIGYAAGAGKRFLQSPLGAMTGARALARRTGEFGKDVGADVTRPIRSFFGGRRAYREERRRIKESPVRRAEEAGREAARAGYAEKYAAAPVRKDMADVRAAGLASDTEMATAIQGGEGIYNASKLALPHVAAALNDRQIRAIAADNSPGSDERKAALATGLASMPQEFAAAFKGAQIQAVLATNDKDLIRGMTSNANIYGNMSASQQGQLSTFIGSQAQPKTPIRVQTENLTEVEIRNMLKDNAEAGRITELPTWVDTIPGLRDTMEDSNRDARTRHQKLRSDYNGLADAVKSSVGTIAKSQYA